MSHFKFSNLAPKRVSNESLGFSDSKNDFEFKIDENFLDISKFKKLKFSVFFSKFLRGRNGFSRNTGMSAFRIINKYLFGFF